MPASQNPFITAPADALRRRAAGVVSAGMLYDDWVLAETEATLALAAWNTAPDGQKSAAYAAYAAARDAEAAAAAQLEHRLTGAR